MADLLEFGEFAPGTPASHWQLHDNNEIHPVNQIWFRKNNEITLMAVVGQTGYFKKRDAQQFEASGLNQNMHFYVAFEIPAEILNSTRTSNDYIEYIIHGMGYEFVNNPVQSDESEVISLKYKGNVRLKITSLMTRYRTHRLSFAKVGTPVDGSIQGYILVETVKITKPGGSINVFVKQVK